MLRLSTLPFKTHFSRCFCRCLLRNHLERSNQPLRLRISQTARRYQTFGPMDGNRHSCGYWRYNGLYDFMIIQPSCQQYVAVAGHGRARACQHQATQQRERGSQEKRTRTTSIGSIIFSIGQHYHDEKSLYFAVDCDEYFVCFFVERQCEPAAFHSLHPIGFPTLQRREQRDV